ncbi:MAG: SpoIID/LytB domain-containing protein [Syntrophomonadales bacterium]|jgi:stage II sporulation protein D
MQNRFKDIFRNKTSIWLLGIAAILLVGIMIVNQEMRAPTPRRPVTPAPEVKKYKEEPEITVYLHQSNTTEKMPLEKYLEGVVAAEIGPKFPEEALKAQAIVARTMTMAKIIRGGVRDEHNTDTCDLPEHFQAYSRAKVTPEISKAVKETRGQVLLYNGKFVYALFHSYAGPRTASLQESFPELSDIAGAYTEVVDSPGAKYAPPRERRWQASIPKSELQAIFGSGADLNAIKITRKGPSGRAIDITAGDRSIKGYDLRTRLGPERLRSTLISDISVKGNNVVFTGTGWGHGCGMAQWGAYEMAKEGKTAKEILNHYYPKTDLFTAWE